MDAMARIYPEIGLFGFSRDDQEMLYLNRVRAVLSPESRLLEFGAGRGRPAEKLTGRKRDLADMRDACAEVCGVDVIPEVSANPLLHEGRQLEEDGTIPYPDATFDVVCSWAVFEHVSDACVAASEIDRVLKPGGGVVGWTPNAFGYIAVGARLVPQPLHGRVLSFLAPSRESRDTFPAYYRMNTRKALRRLFPGDRYEHFSHFHQSPPALHGNRMWLARLWQCLNHVAPPALWPYLHVAMRKRR